MIAPSHERRSIGRAIVLFAAFEGSAGRTIEGRSRFSGSVGEQGQG